MADRAAQPRRGAKIVAGAFLFLLLGAVAGFFALPILARDPEVTDDIDDHFEQLEGGSYAPVSKVLDPPPKEERRSQRSAPRLAEETALAASSRQRRRRGTQARDRRSVSTPKAETAPPSFEGIEQLAPGTYALERRLVNEALRKPSKYLGGARASLAGPEHAPEGFRIQRIAPGSALHAVGLRSGDVIESVNGHPLKSLEKVMLAVAVLRNASRFRLDIRRGGARRSLYYKVE